MILRKWQSEAIDIAIKHYLSGRSHFFTLATPGAGKTIYATKLARELLNNNLIDLVISFSPTSIVALDFTETLESEFSSRFDGKLGAKGHSTTYQSMQYLGNSFWNLLDEYRVFVIFDEIHHCAGQSVERANAWGEQILLNVQNRAAYTLALTGTPWRSDSTPIVLSKYCNEVNNIVCDYIYGLEDAIRDSVCRVPQISVLDNDQITIENKGECRSVSSIRELLKEKWVSYKSVIEDEDIASELIRRAVTKLDDVRKENISAGGLVVANSVEHAHTLKELLEQISGEDATIVTYQEESPSNIIQNFRNANTKWLISVGMVSEGTNIPRLQVCVHLTNIKTELHFRQILGRILRATKCPDQTGYMFMLAHPQLMEYSYRIAEDIPSNSSIIHVENVSVPIRVKRTEELALEPLSDNTIIDNNQLSLLNAKATISFNSPIKKVLFQSKKKRLNPLSQAYNNMFNITGKYRHEVLKLSVFEDHFRGQ